MKSRARVEFVKFYTGDGPGFSFKWFALNCMQMYTLDFYTAYNYYDECKEVNINFCFILHLIIDIYICRDCYRAGTGRKQNFNIYVVLKLFQFKTVVV